jgi:acyl-CoA reductase-like NAD-dependent aldehyde dehydrogenase
MHKREHYIGGAWRPAEGKLAHRVVDPSSEEVFAQVAAATPREVAAACAAASQAFDAWQDTPVEQRCAALERVADGLAARADDLTRLVAAEVGMPVRMSARLQVANPIEHWRRTARAAREFAWSEQIGNSLVEQVPVGVVGAVTPWNFPLHQISLKLAPALAAGCTVVLKPSEVAPLNAFALAEVIHEAGFPPGVFNLVAGDGAVTGEALALDRHVDALSFTGSTRAGRRVAGLAAAEIKRVALELGGKSASVVLPDADLAAAVRGTLNACFLNSGQACNALSRLLVPRARMDEAADIAAQLAATYTLGPAQELSSRLGPLVSAGQRERVRGLIRSGVAEGARLVCGGTEAPAHLPRGWFVQPTVFADVRPDMRIAREEIFGPVLSILAYEDLDHAVALANGTDYGLAAAVWSADEAAALAVARRLRAGQVEINGGHYNPLAPFGGFKRSGLGREGGRYGLEEFLEPRALQRRAA